MNKKGFTLVELMVVIVILFIVALFLTNVVGRMSEREIVKIRENTQVIIDQAKKLKEENVDKVKVKQASPEPSKRDEKKAEVVPKIEAPKPDEQTKPPEGLKPL